MHTLCSYAYFFRVHSFKSSSSSRSTYQTHLVHILSYIIFWDWMLPFAFNHRLFSISAMKLCTFSWLQSILRAGDRNSWHGNQAWLNSFSKQSHLHHWEKKCVDMVSTFFHSSIAVHFHSKTIISHICRSASFYSMGIALEINRTAIIDKSDNISHFIDD